MKYILTLVLVLSFGSLKAQDEPDPNAPLQQQNLNTEEQTKTKLGIKMTLGAHRFLGNAFDNERLLYGFGAGVYNIVKLNKAKTINLQWGIDFTFRGSKFGLVNDTSYSKISLAYCEIPVLLSLQLLNTPKKLPLHLLVGAQFGVLFRSSVNKSYGQFGEVKTNLPFKPFDVMQIVGVRKEIGSGMAMQLCVKSGLLNIWTNKFYERSTNPNPDNTNVDYRDLTPAFRDGTHQVRNLSIEFSLLF